MQDGAVLNAGFRPNVDVIHVPADGHVRPNAGALAHGDVANDDGAGVDVSGDSDAGSGAAKRTNHVAGVDLMLTRGVGRHFGCVGAVRWIFGSSRGGRLT